MHVSTIEELITMHSNIPVITNKAHAMLAMYLYIITYMLYKAKLAYGP